MKKIHLLLLFFIYSLTSGIFAQPGALDLTFNPNDSGSGQGYGANNEVYATAVQSDGKILIGGVFTSYNGVARRGIARLNIDGTLDTSFDPGTGVSGNLSKVTSIAIKTNGSIIIGGHFTSYNGVSRNHIAQLNPDGTLDTTFDPGTGANSPIYAVLVKSDGRILIGGSFTLYDGVVRNRIASINADGSIDNFFLPGNGANNNITAMGLQGSGIGGKIIIAGLFTTYDNVTKKNIARLNSDGSIDNSFYAGTGTNNDIEALAIQSDGKILVGGWFTTFNGTTQNHITRLNFNGDLDNTFNSGTGTGTSSSSPVYCILPLSSGKIIIGGSFGSYGGITQYCIARINSNGTLDTGFNSAEGAINTISLQSDGKLIVGGNFNSYDSVGTGRITRISENGNLDTTFNPLLGSGGANGVIRTIAMQSDNKILITGDFTMYNGIARIGVARANPDGSIDPTFNAGAGPRGKINAIAVQNDGKIIVGGDFQAFNNQFAGAKAIVRLNSDGSLDSTFNSGNSASTESHQSGDITKIIPLNDGKILISGSFAKYDGVPRWRIARLNANGSLDTTFNPGADLIPITYPNSNTILNASIELQSDGKIIIFGVFEYSYNGDIKNSIIRVNPDGSYDPTFDSEIGIPFLQNNRRIVYAKIQPDGKILISGNFEDYNAIPTNYLCRLNSDGSFDATFDAENGPSSPSPLIVGVQADGKIIINGGFSSFNNTAVKYLARLNPNGTVDTTFDPGTSTSPGSQPVTAILQPDEKILIGGMFTSYNGIGRSRIARVLRNCVNNSTGTDTIIACGSHTWLDGKLYTENDTTATYTFFDASTNGCDSVVQLDLTILPLAEKHISDTACNTYTWTSGNGQTYTSSTTVSHIITGAGVNGCDSVVTLHLTILEPATYTDNHTACDSYTWIDNNTYFANNNIATYIVPGGAANGCDSIVTLNLTINHPTTGVDTIIACESFTWIDSITYITSNNTATYTIPHGATNGCDSIVILDLTINQPTTGTDVQTACGSFTWIDGIKYTASNHTATHILTNSNNCDSLVTLDLTILPIATKTDVQTACDSYTWINGITYTSNNSTATHIIQNGAANGCDSVITLNLTVTKINSGIANNGTALFPNENSADSYEWIDCNTNEVVYTGKNFHPVTNGKYKVKITKGNCTKTSDCQTIDKIGVKEINGNDFIIYPNPTKDVLFVKNSDDLKINTVRILSLTGQKLLIAYDTNKINVSSLVAGCYFIEINGTFIKIFVKE